VGADQNGLRVAHSGLKPPAQQSRFRRKIGLTGKSTLVYRLM
jgi:hypothetical protein